MIVIILYIQYSTVLSVSSGEARLGCCTVVAEAKARARCGSDSGGGRAGRATDQ